MHPGRHCPPIGVISGGYFPIVYTVPVVVAPPPILFPIPMPVPSGGGLMLPNPNVNARSRMASSPSAPRPQPAKSEGFVNLGDKLFRAGNHHRAEQRYLQAEGANPNAAAPHVRLSQVSFARGDYAEAAAELRAALRLEPGFLVNAGDVQRLFGEPADFARAIARLETHLQGTPGDRDAWLVLGAEWFLSGRTRQAADVFTRLNDRKPDQALAAFLDATTPDAAPRDGR